MSRSRPEPDTSRRQHIAGLIRRKRIEAGMEQADLAKRIGVTPAAVGNWERCLSRPDLDTLPLLCRALRISAAELLDMEPEMTLTGDEREAMESYRRLSPAKRRMVRTLMEQMEWDELRGRMQAIRSGFIRRNTYGQSAAAGPGGPMEEYAPPEEVFVRDNPCSRQSTLIVTVNGHSMEPVYEDGSMVYVDETQPPREGDDVVVIYENTMYIKRFEKQGLVSCNRDRAAYPVIRVNDWRDAKYVGKVIGRVNDYDIPDAKELRQIEEAFSPDYD